MAPVTLPAETLGMAMEMAPTIAGNAPLAVRAARTVLRESRDLTEAQALALETSQSERLRNTEDAAEGPRAFLEKRTPIFVGR